MYSALLEEGSAKREATLLNDLKKQFTEGLVSSVMT